MTLKEAERICITRAKAGGATEYVTLDIDLWDGKEAPRKYGERAGLLAATVHPGALRDPDLSDWWAGKLVLLLPVAAP